MKRWRHHIQRILPFSLVFGLAVVTGCTSETTSPDDNQQTGDQTSEAKSDLKRNTSPQVSKQDQEQLRDGNNAFALDIYQQFAKDAKNNVWLSPTSISLALAMTYAGARGDTAKQMAQALHFNLPGDRLHAAFNDLDLQLSSRGNKPVENGLQPLELHVANSMWLQKGYPFQKTFLDTLAVNYGAGLNLLDFGSDPQGSRKIINEWVEDKTKGRIEDLLPADAIDTMTRFVIANAIYFKGSWKYQFEKSLTESKTFHAPGGDVKVPMMAYSQAQPLRWAKMAGSQVVRLPYAGDEADMTIVLPDEGSFASVESGLSPTWLRDVDSALADSAATAKPVMVSLPKFTFSHKKDLAKGPMQALGMKDAFDPKKADFSGIDGTRNLYISGIYHKAFVGVDEEGTEAAAATAVVGRENGIGPTDVVKFVVDRPFLFYIRDIQTGTILFIGRVTDPSKK